MIVDALLYESFVLVAVHMTNCAAPVWNI